jgi:hypothetical protein
MSLNAKYHLSYVEDVAGTDALDDNVDVFVDFVTGERYVATFFTIANIQRLMDKDAETGECAGGLYFWATDMVIVRSLTRQNIERTIADLLATGTFESVFRGPTKQE